MCKKVLVLNLVQSLFRTDIYFKFSLFLKIYKILQIDTWQGRVWGHFICLSIKLGWWFNGSFSLLQNEICKIYWKHHLQSNLSQLEICYIKFSQKWIKHYIQILKSNIHFTKKKFKTIAKKKINLMKNDFNTWEEHLKNDIFLAQRSRC